MDRVRRENASQSKALKHAALGGAWGLGAALALVFALMAGFSSVARAQTDEALQRPSLVSAMDDCESGARAGDPGGRALGACDILVRAADLPDETRARALINRGVIAFGRGQRAAARGDFEQALALAPLSGEAWLNLSAAQSRTGLAAAAVESARQARRNGADAAASRFNEAIALELTGAFDAAYDAYVDAAALAPTEARYAAQPPRFTRHAGR